MGTCEKMDFTRPNTQKQERDVTRQCLVVCLLFLTFLVFFYKRRSYGCFHVDKVEGSGNHARLFP